MTSTKLAALAKGAGACNERKQLKEKKTRRQKMAAELARMSGA